MAVVDNIAWAVLLIVGLTVILCMLVIQVDRVIKTRPKESPSWPHAVGNMMGFSVLAAGYWLLARWFIGWAWPW